MHDDALVVSLVRAWLITDRESLQWVPPYRKIRWSRNTSHCVSEHVGGHWRRKAFCKQAVDSLACVCKQTDLVDPSPQDPPLGRKRRR